MLRSLCAEKNTTGTVAGFDLHKSWCFFFSHKFACHIASVILKNVFVPKIGLVPIFLILFLAWLLAETMIDNNYGHKKVMNFRTRFIIPFSQTFETPVRLR